MNDHIIVTTAQLFKMFPDQESAHKYLESRLWKNGVKCPCCGLGDRITPRKESFYRCNQCREDLTVRTGTIFERSHVQLHKWLYAMYLLMIARKGISSLQLSKEIGITQKSAWFVLKRLHAACGNDPTSMKKIVEIDETHVSGNEKKLAEKNCMLDVRSEKRSYPTCENAVVAQKQRWQKTLTPGIYKRNFRQMFGWVQCHIPTSTAATGS